MLADLPALMLGALAAPIGLAFGFGEVGLGFAIGSARGFAAFVAVPAGRLIDAWGAVQGLRIAAGGAAVALAFAGLAWNLGALIVAMAVSGIAIAFFHSAANRLLAAAVQEDRQGRAFGLKQAAPAAATCAAGATAVLVAESGNWRAGYGGAAIVALVAAVWLRRRYFPRVVPVITQSNRGAAASLPLPLLMTLWAGFGLSTAAATTLPAFFVVTSIDRGLETAEAATVLTVAGVIAVAVRVFSGRLLEAAPDQSFLFCAAMVASGGLAVVGMALGSGYVLAVVFVVALTTLWGFNGVFWFAVVRLQPARPAGITGLVAPAGHVGGTIGPATFGLIAGPAGASLAWGLWSVVAVAGAAAFLSAHRQSARVRELEPDSAQMSACEHLPRRRTLWNRP